MNNFRGTDLAVTAGLAMIEKALASPRPERRVLAQVLDDTRHIDLNQAPNGGRLASKIADLDRATALTRCGEYDDGNHPRDCYYCRVGLDNELERAARQARREPVLVTYHSPRWGELVEQGYITESVIGDTARMVWGKP